MTRVSECRWDLCFSHKHSDGVRDRLCRGLSWGGQGQSIRITH